MEINWNAYITRFYVRCEEKEEFWNKIAEFTDVEELNPDFWGDENFTDLKYFRNFVSFNMQVSRGVARNFFKLLEIFMYFFLKKPFQIEVIFHRGGFLDPQNPLGYLCKS